MPLACTYRRLVVEDAKWAAMSSASPSEAAEDEDCKAIAQQVDEYAAQLRDLVSERVLAVKRSLAREAQERIVVLQRHHAVETAALSAELDNVTVKLEDMERELGASVESQLRLASAIAEAKREAQVRLAAAAAINAWQRSIPPLKREEWAERQPEPHYRRKLFRKVLCRWRSAARKLRQTRIDTFWEGAVEDLKGGITRQYEHQLAQLQEQLMLERQRTADACRAHDALGQKLKSAFMRGVCQLNLQASKLMGRLVAQ
ncbi:hypothetical protein AB1Y20_003100 [Prymnesium parvum]|uniref:Centrosomal protein POC5 n=1 Tax=Prymnesium parvum TaxID=97485 RepID=A0AB34JDC0_PRYPA